MSGNNRAHTSDGSLGKWTSQLVCLGPRDQHALTSHDLCSVVIIFHWFEHLNVISFICAEATFWWQSQDWSWEEQFEFPPFMQRFQRHGSSTRPKSFVALSWFGANSFFRPWPGWSSSPDLLQTSLFSLRVSEWVASARYLTDARIWMFHPKQHDSDLAWYELVQWFAQTASLLSVERVLTHR